MIVPPAVVVTLARRNCHASPETAFYHMTTSQHHFSTSGTGSKARLARQTTRNRYALAGASAVVPTAVNAQLANKRFSCASLTASPARPWSSATATPQARSKAARPVGCCPSSRLNPSMRLWTCWVVMHR